MDDYTAWVTGPGVSANIKALQRNVMPKVKSWARASGVTFEVEKTKLIHFTQNADKDDTPTQALIF